MKPPKRIIELCERLTSPGHCPSKLSASEFHELVDFIYSIEDEKPEPLTAGEILELARDGEPIPPLRALATYADPKNWVQLYGGVVSISAPNNYEPRECEWAFTGPVRPPYELAQNAIGREMPNEKGQR